MRDQETVFSVHVILLNWNRCDDTLECLASLRSSTYHPLHLLVVDQHSNDSSPSRIRATYPEVEVVELGQNVGFAAGMNAGICHALEKRATHLLLLNNDTIVHPEMVAELMAQLKPGVGMVGPAIFYYDRPVEVWSTGGDIHPLLLEMSGNHGRDRALPSQPEAQGFLSGCALLMPRATVERVGLWDERFFMYYEDLDYCLRIKESGLTLVLAPAAHLWHKVSASSGGSASPAERYQMAKSSGLYFRKYMELWRAPFILLFRLGSALLWTWRLARQARWNALAAYWHGLGDGWL